MIAASAAMHRRVPLRAAVILTADIVATLASLPIALALRLEHNASAAALDQASPTLFLLAISAGLTFVLMGVHRRPWRFTTSGDVALLAASAAITIALYFGILRATAIGGAMPRSTPFIQWFVLLFLLCAARLSRRYIGDYLGGAILPPAPLVAMPRAVERALLVGDPRRVELLLRQLERRHDHPIVPVGILLDRKHEPIRLRGIPVLGSMADLEGSVRSLQAKGERPQCVLYAGEPERLRGRMWAPMLRQAQQLGLSLAYLPDPAQFAPTSEQELDVRYLDLVELLDRPQTTLPFDAVVDMVAGRRVLVTGAGGTIGRELARQLARCGPERLLLLDANEFNLYEADLELRESHPSLDRVPLLCSIRQRAQLMALFREHQPALVFHAAALKHVPLVENHPSAGIQTNVIGTRNVADAARRFGALAMVQVSTDKAVDPVGFMGVTKRLGELYCQALDLAGADLPYAPRFMTVRFGNVLGSSGSLIPLLQRQLRRGGPLTITHPDIERFFMTVDEAVQLVLHAATRGLQHGAKRGRIFVLDMGAPIRVVDIARRLIRLAGLEPDADIKIDIVGLRPGEKLYEELFDPQEARLPSTMPGILEAESRPLPLSRLTKAFDTLGRAAARGDDAACVTLARRLIENRPEPVRDDGVDGAPHLHPHDAAALAG